ncbi:hypothetical protein KP509_11G019200 [Ceratopteris richardii]|nr:hypothetical protein KP509_11G019200 [Ceratopteris richardii]
MYGKCGKTLEAEKVFYALSQHDVISWTAMISTYVEAGLGEEGLLAFRQMQEESCRPNKTTFVVFVQACCCLAERVNALGMEDDITKDMALEIGRACHIDAYRMSYMSNLLSNILVNLYSKCDAILEAEIVLGTTHQPHIVSWNALLSAYIRQGDSKKALLLFMKMQTQGVVPELHTLVFALQACTILAEDESTIVINHSSSEIAFEIGTSLHQDTRRRGCDSDVYVGTSLLSMYGKVGRVSEAESVFRELSYHDLASCNAMLTLYAEQGLGNRALQFYRQMCKEGMSLNQLTFVTSLQGCNSLCEKADDGDLKWMSMRHFSLEIVQALHSDAQRKGYASDVLVSNTLISLYGNLGALREAEGVFYALSQRTVVSWTAMISIYAENNQGHKGLLLFRLMQEEKFVPNQLTFVASLQACSALGPEFDITTEDTVPQNCIPLEIGRALHADCCKAGYMLDPLVSATVLSMYGNCGELWEVESIFTSLPYFHVDPCNVALTLYVSKGEDEQALLLYRLMQQEQLPFSYTTLVCTLQACSGISNLEICYEVHFHIIATEFDWIPSVNVTLIHAYGSCASMIDAYILFHETSEPEVSAWTSYIGGYANCGKAIEALHVLENIPLAGYSPNAITWMLALLACSRAGLAAAGIEYFVFMRQEHGFWLEAKLNTILIDLFGRAGDFKSVDNLLLNMAIQEDPTVWSCLLSACRLHGHIKQAEHAFDHILKLQPKTTASYVLMSNIYADPGMLHSAEVAQLGSVCFGFSE